MLALGDYGISFTHETRYERPDYPNRFTRCYICKLPKEDEDAEFVGYGEAHCHPNDNFCRATGRKIALSRAITAIPNKKTRKEIWEKYFEKVGKK